MKAERVEAIVKKLLKRYNYDPEEKVAPRLIRAAISEAEKELEKRK